MNVSLTPKNAVAMGSWVVTVEGDSMCQTRRRFAEHKTYPNGFESNDTGDETTRGDPTVTPLPYVLVYRSSVWRGKVYYRGVVYC